MCRGPERSLLDSTKRLQKGFLGTLFVRWSFVIFALVVVAPAAPATGDDFYS